MSTGAMEGASNAEDPHVKIQDEALDGLRRRRPSAPGAGALARPSLPG